MRSRACALAAKKRLAITNMHVFFLHNNLHSTTTNKTCFLYARVVLTSSFQRPETRCEVLWNFSMVMSGWQVTSQVTSTYYYGIKLHQSCAVYCAVWCIDLYTKAQKVQGRPGSSEGLKIWRGNRFFFSSEGKSLLLWLPESGRGGTSPPRLASISDGPGMAGGWGVSPLSVRSYGKYAAAGDISEQPSFLSDDVSIYNSQNACLCCHRIFFSLNARFPLFSAWGIGNCQTIGCVITNYKVPL